jgi:hypothetical protein
MSYNLGTNIGSVENGNPTGQVYSTKIVRVNRSIGVCNNTGNIDKYGSIISRCTNNGNIGYISFPIISPFALGTKPKHITINNIKILTSANIFVTPSALNIACLIIPNTPQGQYGADGNTTDQDNAKTLGFVQDISFLYLNYTPYLIANKVVNQVIYDQGNDIESINVVFMSVNNTAFALSLNSVLSISIDYSFE